MAIWEEEIGCSSTSFPRRRRILMMPRREKLQTSRVRGGESVDVIEFEVVIDEDDEEEDDDDDEIERDAAAADPEAGGFPGPFFEPGVVEDVEGEAPNIFCTFSRTCNSCGDCFWSSSPSEDFLEINSNSMRLCNMNRGQIERNVMM